MGVTLLLCLPAARGRVRVLGRCAEILAPLLWAVFALVFLLGFKNVDAACLRLPDSQPVGRALAGMLPLTAALCSAVHLGFLADTAEQDKLAGPCAKAMAALGALGLLLSVTVLGTFGAELSGKINYPFFVMIRSLRILHLIERMEALVVAQWVAADYLLLSALLRSAARALTAAAAGPDREADGRTVFGCAAAAALAGRFCASTAFGLHALETGLIPRGNALLALGVLPLCFLAGKLRRTL